MTMKNLGFGALAVLTLASPLLASGSASASVDDVDCRIGMNQKPVKLEKSPAGFFQIAVEDPNFKNIDVIIDPRVEERKARVYLHDFATKATLNVWTGGIGKDQIVQLALPSSNKEIWLECDFPQDAAPGAGSSGSLH